MENIRHIIIFLLSALIVSGCNSSVVVELKSVATPKAAFTSGPSMDTEAIKDHLRTNLLPLPLTAENLAKLLRVVDEVALINPNVTALSGNDNDWSPEALGFLLTRLITEIEKPDMVQSKDYLATTVLAIVTALNDFVSDLVPDPCTHVSYSQAMAVNMGKKFQSLMLKSSQLAKLAPLVYLELSLVKNKRAPTECRNTIRYATARALIAGSKNGGLSDTALAGMVTALVKAQVAQSQSEGVFASAISNNLATWTHNVLDNNTAISSRGDLLQTLRSAVSTAATESGVTPTATPAENADPVLNTFVNDSNGSQAQFRWQGLGNNLNVVLAWSRTRSEVDQWDGTTANAPAHGGIITDRSQCTADFRLSTSGPLSAEDRCGIDLSTSWARWEKIHVRLSFQNTVTKKIVRSPTRTAGNVPAGMVLISTEDWPTDATLYEPIGYDFAIDKFESSLSSRDTVLPIATSLGALSQAGVAPVANGTWSQFVALCNNRNSDGNFSSWNPSNGAVETTFHLASDNEWFVAAADTQSEFCNISSGKVEAAGTRPDCISRFGSRDMIGNLSEWTYNRVNLGTNVRETLPNAAWGWPGNDFGPEVQLSFPAQSGPVSLWDPLSASPIAVSSISGGINGSVGTLIRTESGTVYPGRGGDASSGPAAGQLAMTLLDTASSSSPLRGGRCAIQRPKVFSADGSLIPKVIGYYAPPENAGNLIGAYWYLNTLITWVGSSFNVLDLSNPYYPMRTGYQTYAFTGNMIAAVGNMLYSYSTNNLFIYSNPAPLQFSLIGSIQVSTGNILSANIAGSLLAIASPDGVRLYSLGSGQMPILKSFIAMPGGISQAQLVDETLLATSLYTDVPVDGGSRSLSLYDITNPSNPIQRGSVADVLVPSVQSSPITGSKAGLNISRWDDKTLLMNHQGLNAAWQGCQNPGMGFLDISDLGNPKVVSTIPDLGSIVATRMGNYVIGTAHYCWVKNITDYSNIKNPRRIASGSWTARSGITLPTDHRPNVGALYDSRGYLIITFSETFRGMVVMDMRGLMPSGTP